MKYLSIEKLKVWQGVVLGLAAVALVVFLAFAIPLNFLSDNVGNYTGAKRIAAEDAIEMANTQLDIPPVPFKFLKATVEDVVWKCDNKALMTLPEDYRSYCKDESDYDKKCSGSYWIKIGYRSVFGIKTSEPVFNGMNLDPHCE